MRTFAAVLALASALPLAAQADWKQDYDVLRLGLISSENATDRLAKLEPLKAYLAKALGVEIEFFTAANYDGTIQALAANQIEFATLGSSGYAAAWTLTNGGVEPIGVPKAADGNTGYFAEVIVRCDSGLKTIDDLKGKVLAFADPDSTSGYNVPYYNLKIQGYEPETFFSAIPFSGSHEAGVMGVATGQFDSAATHFSTPTAGVVRNMEKKGMIETGVICSVWSSPEITNSPFTARSNLPRELIDEMREALVAMPEADPVAWTAYGGENVAFQPVGHETYQWIVDMREWFRTQRRG